MKIRSDRAGTGILILLALVLMLSVFVAGIGQLTLTSRVQRDGVSLIDGERARLAVQSALDEAAAQFSRQANEPDSSIFARLRAGGPFDGKVAVPASARLFGGKGPLDSDSVRFEYRPCAVADGQYSGGQVRFHASAGSGWMRRDARRGSATREVRVAPVTPPQPFDEPTLLVLSPFPGLVDPNRANIDLEEDVRKSRELEAARGSLDGLVQAAKAHLDKAGPIGEHFAAAVASVPELALPRHPEYSHAVEDRFHFIDATAVVASFEPRIEDLQALPISSALVDEMAADVEQTAEPVAICEKQLRETLRKILETDPAQIEEAWEADESSHGEAEKVIEKLRAKLVEYRNFAARHANALLARSMRYTRLTDQLVEYTSDKARQVRSLAAGMFDVEKGWAARASFRFASANELKGFLDGYRARGEGVRGIAWQADAQSPLELNALQIDGRLAIATPAQVVGSGSGPEAADTSLTVVTPRFRLDGRCQAAVVCRQYQGAANGALTGRLLIQELRSEADLAGSLTASAPTGSKLHALVSPWCVEQQIQRGS